MDLKPDDHSKVNVETAEDYEKIQNVKLKFWVITKTFYIAVIFIFLLIIMGIYLFIYEKDNRELITQGITNITQILTVILQAIFGV